ncbi:hypothetical protein GCM10010259_31660 [Streptomyces daghestanicus]|nr:hypothetical protein GCM10010259_31660 [Streptomyces daghestanicus]
MSYETFYPETSEGWRGRKDQEHSLLEGNEGSAYRSRWLMTFDTPSPCMDTPYSASATSIVRF